MENLTPITLPQLDVEALAERAATIRDAINAKSVSAQQVGALFYDLVEYCGNVRDALSLFINSNLPEIQQDIDRRLAGVDSAVEKADAELQKSEAARALVESLVASLSSQNLAAPLRIDIRRCPGSVTLTNAMRPRIDAALFPASGLALFSFTPKTPQQGLRLPGKLSLWSQAPPGFMPWQLATRPFIKL